MYPSPLTRRGRAAAVAGLLSAVVAGQAGLIAVAAHAVGATYTVSTTADVATNFGACGNSSLTVAGSPLSLREAVCFANNAHTATINVPAGTYNLTNGELQLGKVNGDSATLNGAGSASTVISAGGLSRVFDLDPSLVGGVTTSLSGVTISGGTVTTFGGAGIIAGSAHASSGDTLTISSATISGNTVNSTATNRPGGGVQFEGGSLTITNSTISSNTAGSSSGSGVDYIAEGNATGEQLTVTGSTFSGNNVNASAAGVNAGGALYTAGPATVAVSGTRFVNNTVVGSGTGVPQGAGILSQSGTLNVTGSTFTGNSVTGGSAAYGGAISVIGGTATAHDNRITGNTGANGSGVSLGVASGATMDATDNWWGCNAGPGSAGCDSAAGGPTVSPRLVLTAAASPVTVVGPNATSTITASLTQDSLGTAVGAGQLGAFAGLPVGWSDPQPGSASVTPASSAISAGAAGASYNSGTGSGTGHVLATLDNATVTAALTVDLAPAFTGGTGVGFRVGSAGSFTVTTSGFPAPAIARTGTLPPGMTFTDNGNGTATLAGTPTASGSYPLSLTASNGVAPNATMTLTATVTQVPAFTSSAGATFAVGAAGSFSVTTVGSPPPAITEIGALPAGLTFTDNSDGTATLAGTPITGGVQSIALTANNGISPNATQTLTITVNQAPAVTTNPSDQSVGPGTSVTFTAAATGTPTPTVQWQRSTNGGASFTNIAGATATSYTFTAAQGDDANMYRAVFTNGVSSATTTAATLSVGTAPSISSANATAFTALTAGSFTVTASGFPAATLSTTGTLPAWLSLTDNGDGTGTLAGTPPAGSGGTYAFTLHAANGRTPAATQAFTLTVDESPAITSANHTTFLAGTAGSFLVTTTAGFPVATTLSQTSALPSGVTFTDNGDGTATLAGTPAAGTAGSYPITITATNGASPAASQNFTITVHESPVITSADHAAFTVGSAGSFTVTTAGAAGTAVTYTGTLPSGVSFTPSGSGATIAGTPAAGSGGVYVLTLTASDGVTPSATQSFALTVRQPPQLTSVNNASFSLGVAGSFIVTTAPGTPTSTTITEIGALPAGVSLTDNGDGTATLAGTPTVPGVFPITLRASNGIAPDSTQSFTLTVNQAPVITSANHTTFTVGTSGTFAVTTSPPAVSVAETGALPSGVTFTDNADGTATLAGTPAAGTGGLYGLTITATNATGFTTQSFALTVDEPPAITSTDHAGFAIGTAGSFTVTTVPGTPGSTTITRTGPLPAGVSFTDNGGGTATLAGTPAAGTAGSYPLTITASNGVNPSSTQAFTLTIGALSQSITVTSTPPAPASVGGTYTPAAAADSGLAVVVTVDAVSTSSCSFAGTTVSFDHAGTCTLDFDQPGNSTYAAAPRVQQTFAVSTIVTTVQLTPSAAESVHGQPVTVTAAITSAGGSPAGTVQFLVDGNALGAPVAVVAGQAASPSLADQTGQPLTVGVHTVSAAFSPADAVRFASSTGSTQTLVDKAATTAGVSVQHATITATVAVVAPGSGTPTGQVTFSLNGHPAGSASLVGGTATLTYSVPPGQLQHVSIGYAGDTNFTGSSASAARQDPRIVAVVTSSKPRSRYGWYHTAVTVSFTCTVADAPLVGTCPAPVRLVHSGAGQSITRTITAADGGAATAVVNLNLDLTRPRVHISGVRNGAAYSGSVPVARCVATDALSGVAKCVLVQHRHGDRTDYRVTATDKAGNTATATGHYRVLPITLLDVHVVNGAFQVHAGTAYTLVVYSTARPVYYDAAPVPMTPDVRDTAMLPGGHGRWVLRITMDSSMHPGLWNLGVKIGNTLHQVRVRVM